MEDGKLILCVDDDSDMLVSLRMLIENGGYGFAGAWSAAEGLKAYEQRHPDLIIVDLMMEETDSGTNMVRELKRLGNKAPVYMLSSVGDMLSLSIDHADLGLDGVFQKPVQPEVLMTTLKLRLK